MRYGRRLNASHYLNMRKTEITIDNRKANALRELGGYVTGVYHNNLLVPIVYESGL